MVMSGRLVRVADQIEWIKSGFPEIFSRYVSQKAKVAKEEVAKKESVTSDARESPTCHDGEPEDDSVAPSPR